MNKDLILKTDILDIIFEKRNKAYGAYDLRRFYPDRLKLALGLMLAAAAIFSAFALVPPKQNNEVVKVIIKDEPRFTRVDETPGEKPKKQEIKKAETAKAEPKKILSSQRRFISKITIADRGVKTDSIKTLLPIDNIGTKDIANNHPGPFLITPVKTEPAGDGKPGQAVSVDKSIPMDEDMVEVLPSYPGGMEALKKFLEKHLQTPTDMEPGETVSVRVKFVVDYAGKLKSFAPLADGGQAYNNEVIRVLKKMPDWVPGKAKGENVSVYYVIPVKFTGGD